MYTLINQTVIDPMTTTEKIVALRDLAGLNQNRFSKLIGVAPSTMTRLERGSPNKPSIETLQKIADVFEEVTVDWLEDDSNESLPATLTITGGTKGAPSSQKEGQRLKRFVERQSPPITQVAIAEAMGVSRNQVGSYFNTGRFREPVLNSLLAALTKVLNRPVTAEDILGNSRGTTTVSTTPTNLVAVPRLSVTDRPGLTARHLTELQQNFMPAIKPDSAMYAPKMAVTSDNLGRAYAIEVSKGDRMEPLYFPGYWLLGLVIDPNDYAKQYDGTVAVLTVDGEFMLKKILSNNIRTTDILELGSFTNERGGSVQLRKADIQVMFSIVGILFGLAA
ncbi:hypothetical protein BH09BAC4_BH09BAC4_48550 [soil metagenome]